MDMLRRERETAALVAVRDAFPDLGAAVCIVALEVSLVTPTDSPGSTVILFRTMAVLTAWVLQ